MDMLIILPTYNEAENLPKMLDALLALELPVRQSMLVVDDNSPDGTGQIAEEYAARYPDRVSVLHRAGKQGLGTAYIAGFKVAIERGVDFVLQMDSDFSHDPKYIPDLLQAALEGGYDVVIGSRYVQGGSVDERWGVGRKLLSWWANSVYVRAILRTPIRDATGGFRLWRTEVLRGMGLDRIRSNGYVFQVETAYVAERLGYRIAEVPIHFPDRRLGQSKMSFRVQSEAALRVWQVLWRHRKLNPTMRVPLSELNA